jgi:two-component system nitrate/nitrite response regulator NarL
MYDAPPVRIVVAHEQPLFRHGLKLLLQRHGCRVVGEAGDLLQAIDLAYALQPDVLLLDLEAPSGMDATLETMNAWCPFVRTIVLTADAVDACDEAGAGANVVRKDAPVARLLQAVKPAERSDGTNIERGSGTGSTNRFGLTRREIQIVVAVAEGESNKGAALRLSITEDTVKHHLSNIFDKVGVFSRLELALFAVHHGLVEDVRKKARRMMRQPAAEAPQARAV